MALTEKYIILIYLPCLQNTITFLLHVFHTRSPGGFPVVTEMANSVYFLQRCQLWISGHIENCNIILMSIILIRSLFLDVKTS